MKYFDENVKKGKLDKNLNESKIIMKAEMFVYFKRINLKKKSDEFKDFLTDLDFKIFGEKGQAIQIFDKICV